MLYPTVYLYDNYREAKFWLNKYVELLNANNLGHTIKRVHAQPPFSIEFTVGTTLLLMTYESYKKGCLGKTYEMFDGKKFVLYHSGHKYRKRGKEMFYLWLKNVKGWFKRMWFRLTKAMFCKDATEGIYGNVICNKTGLGCAKHICPRCKKMR